MNELIKLEVSFEYNPRVYVYRRYKGWYWKFLLPNGEWFVGRAPGKSEAMVKKNALLKEKDLMKGLFRQKELDRFQVTSKRALSFDRAVDDYIDHLKAEGASPRYFSCLEKQLKSSGRYIESTFKLRFAHKLTKDDTYKFRRHLLNRVANGEIVKATAFRELNDVKRMYKFLKKRGLIMIDPWDDIDPISVPKAERARKVAPPVDIVEKLMAADYTHRFEFPIKEFVYGLFRTGARMEELLYMELDDVDWKTGEWRIQPKECPMRYGMKWKPKFGKPRTTLIPQDALKLIRPLADKMRQSRVVGYSPDRKGVQKPRPAKFVFTMLDRKLSTKESKVYRRVDTIRAAWGALFVAAGLAERVQTTNKSTKKYKNGVKKRSDMKVLYTRHDMRRAFNLAAKRAGMKLDDRALILGHATKVNEDHYCGEKEFDTEKMSKIVNEKMQKVVGFGKGKKSA